jgi:hypothetical protein
MSLYEVAARNKFRFSSTKGLITTEDLFDLPLESKTAYDLNTVAQTINKSLKEIGEENFVSSKTNPKATELQQKLDLVKLVIAGKLAEQEIARQKAANRAERERLQDLLEQKQTQNALAMTAEEIQAKIAAIPV